jgi:hypothetical protein
MMVGVGVFRCTRIRSKRMKKKVNNCVGCEVCYDYCEYRNSDYYEFYCDECGDETDLYYFENEELCACCALGRLEKVND